MQPIGDAVPRRGNALSRACGRLALRLLRFKIEGELPNEPKFVLIGAPHTSNWDFIISMAVMMATGLQLSWMGKEEMFDHPLRRFFIWMGGLPVDRSAAGGVVGETVEAFKRHEKLIIVVAPEGTRASAPNWKSGFYRIAAGAGVPIVLGYLDFERRVLGFGPAFMPTGDQAADIAKIRSFYANIVPRYSDRYDKTD